MYKALGLETLKVQKEHFDVHVKGKQAKTVTPEVQRMMDYGTENEIHAIATLVALILPAVRPPCFSVYELGSFSINDNIENVLITSPDGLAQCSQGENCEYKQLHTHIHNKIGIEYKCTFQSDKSTKSPNYPSYELPVRHVPQVLSTMAVLDCSQLLLITFTPTSVSVIIVDFDPELWNKLWSKVCFLFDSKNPSIPKRLDLPIKQMRSQLVNFVHTKSHFLFEVLLFHGSILHKIPCTITNSTFSEECDQFCPK